MTSYSVPALGMDRPLVVGLVWVAWVVLLVVTAPPALGVRAIPMASDDAMPMRALGRERASGAPNQACIQRTVSSGGVAGELSQLADRQARSATMQAGCAAQDAGPLA